VKSKLSQPMPLGYCNVGVIEEVGNGSDAFSVGDRVISNGPHADIVKVAKHLCAKIPDNVDNESAAFTVLGSIGLQGIRLAEPTLGECIAVVGVGLIGLLTVQLLKAHGCRVLAIDFDDNRLSLAKQFGAEVCNLSKGEDIVEAGMAFSKGRGMDSVLITADTKSNDPVSHAARMCRKRGRIVLVGVTGLELNRADFYEKELTFQVSCSYGPGRYDPFYEDQGNDYPIGFVRWTEQRNFEAILDMLASRQLNVKTLITHQYAFEEAKKAYDVLTNDRSVLGILLDYSSNVAERNISKVELSKLSSYNVAKPVLGFIGAGNYASRVLIPAFKSAGGQLHTIVTAGGVSGVVYGKKYGFSEASTDIDGMLDNNEINTVVIVTQHNTHAPLVVKALNAGKHVFIEKPLAINLEELKNLTVAYKNQHNNGNKSHLMTGFNRRFAPQVQKMNSLLSTIKEPKSFIFTMNSGAIPANSWVQDNNIGGGRIIGEACHYIDLMRYFAGSEIVSVHARRMGSADCVDITEDKASITLGFADGSFGTIHYLANGAANFPKERLEIFSAGRILQLKNFRKLKGYGFSGFRKMNLLRQNKGQNGCVSAFLNAIENGTPTPISAAEVFEVARVSIEAAEQIRSQHD
ncbi:bi-domain-containing oxidoreductase, partial [Thermodesulfobacteriota bacterium]